MMEYGEGLGIHLGEGSNLRSMDSVFLLRRLALYQLVRLLTESCVLAKTDTLVGAKPPMSHSVEEWKEFANPEIRINVYIPHGYKKDRP